MSLTKIIATLAFYGVIGGAGYIFGVAHTVSSTLLGEVQHTQAEPPLIVNKYYINPPILYSPPDILDNGAMAVDNKNPLNIKACTNGDTWQGQIGVDSFGHAIFSSWEHGIRAASFTLRSYARVHRIDTIEGIVNRFAEGNREHYAKFLSRRLGLGVDEKFNIIGRMPELLRAMARFECGQELPEELFVAYDILAKL